MAKSSVKKPAKAGAANKKSPAKIQNARPIAKPVASRTAPNKNGKDHAKPIAAPVKPPKSAIMLIPKSKVAPLPSKAQSKPAKLTKKTDPNAPRFPDNLPVPQAPVPTNGKPRKNQAGLSAKELEHYRELLLAKRRELVGDMSSMEREALRSSGGTNLSNLPLHMADMGTDNYEQEFTLGLVEKDRNLLREINIALAKIQNGTYGICEGTGKPINKPRLEAQPWAKFSIEYARMLERGGMGIRRP